MMHHTESTAKPGDKSLMVKVIKAIGLGQKQGQFNDRSSFFFNQY